jgi:hypothetical protein
LDIFSGIDDFVDEVTCTGYVERANRRWSAKGTSHAGSWLELGKTSPSSRWIYNVCQRAHLEIRITDSTGSYRITYTRTLVVSHSLSAAAQACTRRHVRPFECA